MEEEKKLLFTDNYSQSAEFFNKSRGPKWDFPLFVSSAAIYFFVFATRFTYGVPSKLEKLFKFSKDKVKLFELNFKEMALQPRKTFFPPSVNGKSALKFQILILTSLPAFFPSSPSSSRLICDKNTFTILKSFD